MLLIVPLSEIKSYVVVLSFYIKMMKRRTFQACSLRHSIKTGMFFVSGKMDLFKSGRGGVLPPWLRACICASNAEKSFTANIPLCVSHSSMTLCVSSKVAVKFCKAETNHFKSILPKNTAKLCFICKVL